MRISYIPKYALTNQEISKYLKEQKIEDTEDYLIQRLMLTYGLRVNTIALLKVKHLEFIDRGQDEEPTIYLPDSKTKKHRVEPIEEELVKLLEEWVKDKDGEDFVFYEEGSDKNERRRAQDICIRINKRIKKSKVIKKKGSYKYTSHMFRKTRAYNMFQSRMKELKEEVRASIGQSSGSMAIEHYIN
jgi:integrase